MKAFVKQHFPAISISRVASEFEVYRKRKDSHNEPGALSGYDFNQVNLGEEKLPNVLEVTQRIGSILGRTHPTYRK